MSVDPKAGARSRRAAGGFGSEAATPGRRAAAQVQARQACWNWPSATKCWSVGLSSVARRVPQLRSGWAGAWALGGAFREWGHSESGSRRDLHPLWRHVIIIMMMGGEGRSCIARRIASAPCPRWMHFAVREPECRGGNDALPLTGAASGCNMNASGPIAP